MTIFFFKIYNIKFIACAYDFNYAQFSWYISWKLFHNFLLERIKNVLKQKFGRDFSRAINPRRWRGNRRQNSFVGEGCCSSFSANRHIKWFYNSFVLFVDNFNFRLSRWSKQEFYLTFFNYINTFHTPTSSD